MQYEDRLGIALTKEICPVCLNEYDGPIVMNTLLTEFMADKVKDLHGKVTGILDKPCKTCVDALNGEDAVYLIGMDPEQTKGGRFQDIYIEQDILQQ